MRAVMIEMVWYEGMFWLMSVFVLAELEWPAPPEGMEDAQPP